MAEKKLLFSVRASDCEFIMTKGSGAGGQKRNKTSNACHCKHPLSGAHGYSEDTRSQLENKRIAFVRMAESREFKKWHKLEISKRMGIEKQIEEEVDRAMRQIRVDKKNEKGLWEEWCNHNEAEAA